MTQLISYTRRVGSAKTQTTHVNLSHLYHNLFTVMERLHADDGFNHPDLLKLAAAMDVIKRMQHEERN